MWKETDVGFQNFDSSALLLITTGDVPGTFKEKLNEKDTSCKKEEKKKKKDYESLFSREQTSPQVDNTKWATTKKDCNPL